MLDMRPRTPLLFIQSVAWARDMQPFHCFQSGCAPTGSGSTCRWRGRRARPAGRRRGVVEYDPFLFYEDPYPIYRGLRDEAPVYLSPERRLWVLSRFDDVQRAGRDWRTFSSAEGVDIDDSRLGPGSFLDADPPRHDELRKLLHADFSPAALRRLEPLIAAKVDALVSALLERGSVDLVDELARRLPVSVVCDLLGAPAEDHPQLEVWYAGMLHREPGRPEVTEPPSGPPARCATTSSPR